MNINKNRKGKKKAKKKWKKAKSKVKNILAVVGRKKKSVNPLLKKGPLSKNPLSSMKKSPLKKQSSLFNDQPEEEQGLFSSYNKEKQD